MRHAAGGRDWWQGCLPAGEGANPCLPAHELQVEPKYYIVSTALARCLLQVGTRAAPFVTLIKGVWMGFGVGATVFGSHRVVTDSVTFAMPECAIGEAAAARSAQPPGLALRLNVYTACPCLSHAYEGMHANPVM